MPKEKKPKQWVSWQMLCAQLIYITGVYIYTCTNAMQGILKIFVHFRRDNSFETKVSF